jgi:hypothetical protein
MQTRRYILGEFTRVEELILETKQKLGQFNDEQLDRLANFIMFEQLFREEDAN